MPTALAVSCCRKLEADRINLRSEAEAPFRYACVVCTYMHVSCNQLCSTRVLAASLDSQSPSCCWSMPRASCSRCTEQVHSHNTLRQDLGSSCNGGKLYIVNCIPVLQSICSALPPRTHLTRHWHALLLHVSPAPNCTSPPPPHLFPAGHCGWCFMASAWPAQAWPSSSPSRSSLGPLQGRLARCRRTRCCRTSA